VAGCSEKSPTTITTPTPTADPTEVSVISISPGSGSVFIGFSLKFVAVPKNKAGAAVMDKSVTWSSTDPRFVNVTQDGVATGLAEGQAMIKASVGGKADSVAITVVATGGEAGRFTAVALGEAHTCALVSTGAAYCWGHNLFGQLGQATPQSPLRNNVPLAVAGGHAFASLSSRYFHTCALTPAGEAYCWGENISGDLGDGTTTRSTTPVRVATELKFASISAGYRQTCAITEAGDAYCWGGNGIGELGDGSYDDKVNPVRVAGGIHFARISAGLNHTCGVSTSGKMYCWGWNQYGMLGNGSDVVASNVPVAVAGDLEFESLSSGRYLFTCALSKSRDGYCWGRNSGGALGINAEEPFRSIPSLVTGGYNFKSISTGFEHSCATSTTGTAYCWGSNYTGQLGNSTLPIQSSILYPVNVSISDVAFTEIVAGYGHTCAISSKGALYCWGWNNSGQLGDGSNDELSAVPRNVRNP
jgi:alpha-tubulin suppressor-like RCC1 family protein